MAVVQPTPCASVSDSFFSNDWNIKVIRISRERETNDHRIKQRQKQIDWGKNTVGYKSYLEAIPKDKRKKEHRETPNPLTKTSKRGFDGQIRSWRRYLHQWDPAPRSWADIVVVEEEAAEKAEAEEKAEADNKE